MAGERQNGSRKTPTGGTGGVGLRQLGQVAAQYEIYECLEEDYVQVVVLHIHEHVWRGQDW